MKFVWWRCRFLESIDEIELILVKLINESMTKAMTIEQRIEILEIFVDFQRRTVDLFDFHIEFTIILLF